MRRFCYVIDPTSGYHATAGPPVDFSLPPAKYVKKVKKVKKAKIVNRS